MKKPTHPTLSPAQIEALEARFALRLSARLDDAATALPHDITERLRVAREQAVRAALRPQVAVATAPQHAPAHQVAGLSLAGASGQATLSGWGPGDSPRDPSRGRRLDDGPLSWGWRLASALPAVALVAGLWGIQSWYRSEKVQAATEVDMALLTDDLPPAAYADPGFEEYLRTEAPPVSAQAVEATPDEAVAADDGEATDEDDDSGNDEAAEAEAQP